MNISKEINNIIFNTELPNFINNTQMNKNMNILKSHCINFILLAPFKTNFVTLVYPKFKNEIHKIKY